MTRAEIVRAFVTEALVAFTRKRAEAYLEDREYLDPFLSNALVCDCELPSEPLPKAVEDCVLFYYLARLTGGTRLARVTVGDRDAFVVRRTTNADDSFVEIFDEDGTPLGAARTYIELVEWVEVDTVRAQTDCAWELPAALAARKNETLWTRVKSLKRTGGTLDL